jgi:hypothetical protein
MVILEMGVLRTTYPGLPSITLLLISASQAARIRGLNHQCLDALVLLKKLFFLFICLVILNF